MGEYSSVLEGFKDLDGIQAALLIDGSGEVLERIGSLPEPVGKLAKLVVQTLEAGQNVGTLLRSGGMEQNYLEYKELNITFVPVSNQEIVVAIAAPGTNLGRIRYEVKKSKKLFDGISQNAEKS